MNNSIKIAGFIALVLILVQSCTGSKEAILNEAPTVQVVGPTWTQIVPGQEDGLRKMVIFLPVTAEQENYAIDSIYFKGYHESLIYKAKSASVMGYQAVITIDKTKEAIIPPFELVENQALISYYDAEKTRHYFKVSGFKEGDSIFMP